MATPARQPPASLGRALRYVVYACTPLLLLLLACELLLAHLGLGDPDVRLPEHRGFDDTEPMLVARPDGGYRTRFYASPRGRYEVDVPPEGAARRVLLLGGSNTQMFPEATLEHLLDAGSGPGAWEVVNLGRMGFGSERVATLLAQAGVLEPDVVVIYSGHNEFIEAAFFEELRARRGPPPPALAFELRTLNAAISLIRRARRGGPVPNARMQLRSLDRAVTRRYLARYHDNLERMVARARDHGAAVVLCTTVTNMLEPPFASAIDRSVPDPVRAGCRAIVRKAIEELPDRFHRGLLPEATTLGTPLWTSGRGNVWRPRLPALGGRLAAEPDAAGVRVSWVPGATWTDPDGWSDGVVAVLRTYEAIVRRELDGAERALVDSARRRLEAALELVPDYPDALYALGLCRWLLGDDEEAVRLLDEAARADRAPRRATPATNEIVREVAARHDEVRLLDAERIVREASPTGLVGYDAVLDNCHLQPRLRAHLMAWIAEAVLALDEP